MAPPTAFASAEQVRQHVRRAKARGQKCVLIGCEFSGTMRDRFAARGHFAVSCDLLPATTIGYHYQGDVFDIIDCGWDLAIFHPPCTYLCRSGLHWNRNPKSERFGGAQTEEALVFVDRLLGANIKRIALENPAGCIGTRIRKADQFVQPYELGDDASKKTGWWLKNLPKLRRAPGQRRFKGRVVEWPAGGDKMVERWSNQTDSGQNRLGPSEDRWAERSLTYPGIADAAAHYWGRVIEEEDMEL